MEIEDLNENDFFLICYENENEGKFFIFTWKGNLVNLEENEYNNFIEVVKTDFFQKEKIKENEIILFEEIPFNESDEFLDLL